MIGNKDHHHVGRLRGFSGCYYLEAGGFSLGAALAFLRQTDDHVEPGIAQIERVGVDPGCHNR